MATSDNKVVFVHCTSDKNEFESKLNTVYKEYKENAIVFIKNSNIFYHDGVYYNEYMIPVTYNDLKVYKETAKLIPGLKYKIIDYCPTGDIPGASDKKYAGNQFDIIVTAKSTKDVDILASVVKHEGGTYSSADMDKWQIHYDSVNNVITWMKDLNGNEAPYDFKNVLFKRYFVSAYIDNSNDDNNIIEGYYAASVNDKLFAAIRISYIKEEHIVADIDTSRFKWFYTFTDDSTFTNNKVSTDNSINCFMNKIESSLDVASLNYVISGDYNTITDNAQVTLHNSSYNTIKNNDNMLADSVTLCINSLYNNITDIMCAILKNSKYNELFLHGYVYIGESNSNICSGIVKQTTHWLQVQDTNISKFKECYNSCFKNIENTICNYTSNVNFNNISNSIFLLVYSLILTPKNNIIYNINAQGIGKVTDTKQDITELLYTRDMQGLEYTQTIIKTGEDEEGNNIYEVRTSDKETKSYWIYI